jgi:hypothetical protein
MTSNLGSAATGCGLKRDRDATVFTFGMIGARGGTMQTCAAEGLATCITEIIAVECEHSDQRYTPIPYRLA